MNKEDNGNRRFVLVQLPERTGEQNFKTIADICKQRLKSAITNIQSSSDGQLALGQSTENLGYKAFKLTGSNFKLWDTTYASEAEELQEALIHVDDRVHHNGHRKIFYELLLKLRIPLTTPVQAITMANKKVFSVAEGAMLICLETEVTLDLVKAMAEAQPSRVICLDAAFKGNDSLKTNAVQLFKSRKDREGEEMIVFRTV